MGYAISVGLGFLIGLLFRISSMRNQIFIILAYKGYSFLIKNTIGTIENLGEAKKIEKYKYRKIYIALSYNILTVMDKIRLGLIVISIIAIIISIFIPPAQLVGLSTILGSTILGSTVLGSTILGSTVLGSTILGSTVLGSITLTTVYAETYYNTLLNALYIAQILLSITTIGLLIYLEITHQSYGNVKRKYFEIRNTLLPMGIILALIFFTIITLKAIVIVTGT